MLDPDEEVRTAIADVFKCFEQAGSACAVVRAFAPRRFPARAYGGAWAGQLRYVHLTHSRALTVLRNPAYAGAYEFGRRHSRRQVQPDGTIRARITMLPREQRSIQLALDEIRRQVWNEARRAGHTQQAKELKGGRFAPWKNPHRLTERQKIKLAQIQQTNKPLYGAYLISQQLREIYRVPYQEAIELLDAWPAWARRYRLQPFVKLAKTITKQREGIDAAIRHGLSNARTEQVNTQLRLITRRAYGFHTPEALIALAMLTLGGLCPPLPP